VRLADLPVVGELLDGVFGVVIVSGNPVVVQESEELALIP
jgi:hypothetical protein